MQGKHNEGVALSEKASAIQTRALGGEHERTIDTDRITDDVQKAQAFG